VARILIVGCGSRGLALARALGERGHAVRGTSRDDGGRARIEAAGVEGAVADPDRPATLLPLLGGTSVVCWLLGSASGDEDQLAALHGPRLHALLQRLIDTPVRGLVYEAAGSVCSALLAQGRVALREIEASHLMGGAIIAVHPDERREWLDDALRAVDAVLSA